MINELGDVDVAVTRTDGTVDTITDARRAQVEDGVLTLWRATTPPLAGFLAAGQRHALGAGRMSDSNGMTLGGGDSENLGPTSPHAARLSASPHGTPDRCPACDDGEGPDVCPDADDTPPIPAPPTSQPTQTCTTCGRWLVVQQTGRGFPPDVAARKLAKLCREAGHKSTPTYRAGVSPNLAARLLPSTDATHGPAGASW